MHVRYVYMFIYVYLYIYATLYMILYNYIKCKKHMLMYYTVL